MRARPKSPATTAVARFLQMFTTMTKYVPNPTYNLMFVNPNMVMPPVPLAPLPYREAKNSLDTYYHAFGDWGDYGYENQSNTGYGCYSCYTGRKLVYYQ